MASPEVATDGRGEIAADLGYRTMAGNVFSACSSHGCWRMSCRRQGLGAARPGKQARGRSRRVVTQRGMLWYLVIYCVKYLRSANTAM